MSALYLEVTAEVSAAQLTSEVALALQDKREVYVSCSLSEVERVERLLRLPFEVSEERARVHEPLPGDDLLLRHLLGRAARGCEEEPRSPRGWGEAPPPSSGGGGGRGADARDEPHVRAHEA